MHKGGSIRFSDGSLTSFSGGAARDSDALSYALLDSEQVLSVGAGVFLARLLLLGAA